MFNNTPSPPHPPLPSVSPEPSQNLLEVTRTTVHASREFHSVGDYRYTGGACEYSDGTVSDDDDECVYIGDRCEWCSAAPTESPQCSPQEAYRVLHLDFSTFMARIERILHCVEFVCGICKECVIDEVSLVCGHGVCNECYVNRITKTPLVCVNESVLTTTVTTLDDVRNFPHCNIKLKHFGCPVCRALHDWSRGTASLALVTPALREIRQELCLLTRDFPSVLPSLQTHGWDSTFDTNNTSWSCPNSPTCTRTHRDVPLLERIAHSVSCRRYTLQCPFSEACSAKLILCDDGGEDGDETSGDGGDGGDGDTIRKRYVRALYTHASTPGACGYRTPCPFDGCTDLVSLCEQKAHFHQHVHWLEHISPSGASDVLSSIAHLRVQIHSATPLSILE